MFAAECRSDGMISVSRRTFVSEGGWGVRHVTIIITKALCSVLFQMK